MRADVPSERNFEVYHAVETYKLTRREAAKRFGISPTRVQQIVVDVKEFLCDHGSVELLNIPPADVELASLRVCYERLNHFYTKVIRQFNTLELSMPGSPATIRLIQAATRISVEQSKVAGRICKVQKQMIESGEMPEPSHTFYQEVLEDDEDERNESHGDEAEQTPLEEGCTENNEEPTEEEQAAVAEVIAKLGPHATFDDIVREALTHKSLNKSAYTPAQPTVVEEPSGGQHSSQD